MTRHERLAAFLVGLYPAAWRQEYGAELQALLLARPIAVGTVNDVVWSALGQRARHLPPPVVLGAVSMVLFTAWASMNVIRPETLSSPWLSLLQPTGLTRPTVIVWALRSEAFVAMLLACGAWTESRYRTTAPRAGFAAMLTTGMAGAPVIVLGFLIAFDVVSFPAHRALPVISATFFEFGAAWVWGALGALASRYVRARRATRTTA